MTTAHDTQSLGLALETYIRERRNRGYEFGTQAHTLRGFVKFLAEQKLSEATFLAYLDHRKHCSPNTLRQASDDIRQFCVYLTRYEPGCYVPDRVLFPRCVPYVAPVILGPADIRAMLNTIGTLKTSRRYPLSKATLRAAVVLLYTTGMRRGEVIRLRLRDVDLEKGIVRINESKFHKSRIIPLSETCAQELRDYVSVRGQSPWDSRPDAPLLGHCEDPKGRTPFRAYCGTGLGHSIRSLFRLSGMRQAHGRLPRVHDLRHSFAVNALLRWYQNGDDVNAKLPALSMYMGHVNIFSTAHYLKLIPELAHEAGRKFQAHSENCFFGEEM